MTEHAMAQVILQWNFIPPDYFERAIDLERGDYKMHIDDGKAEAEIVPAVYDADPGMRQRLHESLNACFLGVQLLTHKAYTLSDPNLIRVDDAGRRHHFIELKTSALTVTANPVDILVTDSEGNWTVDTKKQRIENKLSMAELIAKHLGNDETLATLVRSYDAAVRDPNNELVHLYELRDALQKRFGSSNAAHAVLGVCNDDWRRLGGLCNDEPLRQGRHSGKHGNALRDATDAELLEARNIAQMMLNSYLHYLEQSPQHGATAPR